MPPTPPIVHRDDHIVIADKPAGMLAVGPGSIHEALAAEMGERLFIVHRLDRETSGLIAFARDAETHRYLSGRFEERAVEKVYLAAVSGHLDPPAGSVDLALREFGSGRMGVDRRGKPSHTGFAMLERLTDADLVELRP
ncbi:MAG: pseudouridine synthase, partial [Chloroflexota bacterium]